MDGILAAPDPPRRNILCSQTALGEFAHQLGAGIVRTTRRGSTDLTTWS
ncbi:hypothetical protein ACVDG5_034145 [Mesorhizobium sp. ORM6]